MAPPTPPVAEGGRARAWHNPRLASARPFVFADHGFPMNPLDFLIPVANAQAAAPAAAPSMMSTLLFPVILIAIMYFLMIRPQMKRQKEHKAMLDKLSKGDEVITSGGIAGTVVAMSDAFITVEVASGVQLRVQKGAIASVLPKGTLKSA